MGIVFCGVIIGVLCVFLAILSQLLMTEVNPEIQTTVMNAEAGKNLSAFIVGHTGLVGGELVRDIVKNRSFKRLVLLGRRQVELKETYEGLEQKVIDFENIDKSLFEGLDVGFCCLGTTRGKSGKDGFYKVDHDYAVNVAKAAKEANVKQYHLISSMGAKPNSMLFYFKTKGETEADITAVELPRFHIYRPGGLLGERQETRFTERCANFFLKPFFALAPTANSVHADILARALANTALSDMSDKTEPMVEILENPDIHFRARRPEAADAGQQQS